MAPRNEKAQGTACAHLARKRGNLEAAKAGIIKVNSDRLANAQRASGRKLWAGLNRNRPCHIPAQALLETILRSDQAATGDKGALNAVRREGRTGGRFRPERVEVPTVGNTPRRKLRKRKKRKRGTEPVQN